MNANLNPNQDDGFNRKPKPRVLGSRSRTPWSGNLDDTEILRPGGLLLASLVQHANDNRLQLNEMATALGVTYGYISQLRNGLRSVTSASDEFLGACSRFLGVPRLRVMMLAGKVTPSDYFEDDYIMAAEISRAVGFICADMDWGHLITPELRKADEVSQFGLVKMYEAATGKVLMTGAVDLKSMAKHVAQQNELQAERASTIKGHKSARRKRTDSGN